MVRVKKKEGEELSSTNIMRVIALLEADTPITKKNACEQLRISYNTTRLNKIIAEHKERVLYVEKRKAVNKGKKAQDFEIKESITAYLNGETISEIAKQLYRSPGFVRSILDRIGVPTRPNSAEERHKPAMLPESCVAEEFSPKEVVWSAQYHYPAIVDKEIQVGSKYESKGYRVYIKTGDGGGFYAYALACELGKLAHLAKYGVVV